MRTHLVLSSLAGGMSVAIVLLIAVTGTDSGAGRSLTRTELASLFGGLDDLCCGTDSNCQDNYSPCSTFNNNGEACKHSFSDVLVVGTNKKACNTYSKDTTCTNGEPQTCKRYYKCSYDPGSGACNEGDEIGSTMGYDSCTPNCP